MVSPEEVEKQLKKLKFNPKGWGKSEAKELPHILVPDEEIYELANGVYEAGFALLVSTNIRVILIDRKPMNYLTVEDLRFDMINEIDYSHRLIGAQITITTGSKTLKFTSYNQQRLRKLIGHVQSCMAEIKMKQSKHEEGQVTHLEKINEQLQSYLFAQQQYQQQLQQQLQQQVQTGQAGAPAQPLPKQVRPAPELADYLYARSLLDWHQQRQQAADAEAAAPDAASQAQAQAQQAAQPPPPPEPPAEADRHNPQLNELYDEAVREIYGRYHRGGNQNAQGESATGSRFSLPLDPLRIAYSKLPMALRNRRFGRPAFHPHPPGTYGQQPAAPAPLPEAPR